MFGNKSTKESQTGVVEIKDVRAEVVRTFVEYCYDKKVELIDDTIDILIIADRYQVEGLIVSKRRLFFEPIKVDVSR